MEAIPLRVSLVEDHPVLRDVLREFISRLPAVASCTVAPTAEAALKDLDGGEPDLMLIDLSLPGMSGIELIRELRKQHPGLRCAILSGHRSRTYAGQALAAGANGYMLKGDPMEIERGMRAILAGERYVSQTIETES
jgi:DNA-binding NarL/FixJ family response regulator